MTEIERTREDREQETDCEAENKTSVVRESKRVCFEEKSG